MKSWITDWQRSERLPHYTRANAGETLPEPASPLGWTLVWGRGLHGWRKGFVGFGIYHEEEVAGPRPPFVGMFGGYFYLNLSHMRLFGIRMGQTADQIDAAFVGQRSDTPAYVAHPDDQDGELTAKAGGTLQRMLGQTNFPEADADRERLRRLRRERPDLSVLSDAELVAYARSLLDQVETTFQRHVESSLPASVGPAILGPLCASVDRPGDMLDLIGGLGDVDSASPRTGCGHCPVRWRRRRS